MRAAAATVLLALALLWPAAISRSPVVDPDTLGYMQIGEHTLQAVGAAAHKLIPKSQATGGQAAAPGALAKSDHFSPDRSAYYGVFAASLFAAGGLWLAALSQGLLAGATVLIALRRIDVVGPGRRVAIMLVLVVLSGLAALASTLMPDVFTGAMLLAIALLVAPGSRLSRLERGFLYAMVLAAVLFHNSHILLAGAVVAALAGYALALGGISRRTLGALAATVVVGLVGSLAVNVLAG